MHCSANTDMNGENTALSSAVRYRQDHPVHRPQAPAHRRDEHGWDDNGIFNFEGGCYAKVINLDKESEPDIYNAIKRNALLENVTVDQTGHCDFATIPSREYPSILSIDHIEDRPTPVCRS